MTTRLERLPPLLGIDALNQRRKQQNHVPSLVHDRGAAVRTADLAGQFVAGGFLRWIVPGEVVVAVREIDVVLVENGGPLEGGAVEALARGAVAVFGGKGFLAR